MIDLEKVSGIPMEIGKDFRIKYKSGTVQKGQTWIRKFSDVQPVFMDQTIKQSAEDYYWGYRGICLESDSDIVANENLSYDVTMIPAIMLGEEYNKTVGHYHSAIPGSTIAYPEMYEVLHGKALFLLQKMDSEMKKVQTVLAIEAEQGDKVIYPPNYGHIIVNIGDETLITANWVSTKNKSDYEPIKNMQGMALYVVKGKDGKPTFVKNPKYKDQPMMRKMAIADKIRTDFGIDTKEPMYTLAMKNPKLLDFLNHPAKYAVQLSALSS